MEAGVASSGGRGCRESGGDYEGGDFEPVKKDKVERERKEKNMKKMEKRRRGYYGHFIFSLYFKR